MTDVSGKFFSAKKVRTGVSPSSPGVEVGETLPPVNPPGGGLNSVGLTMPSAFAVANSPLTSNGTLEVTGAGTVAQYVRGDGTLASFPSLTGYVPYTGATADVNLGTHDLTAERGTFTNNGSSDTLTVNHTSGSGYGIKVTKGGNNEALLVTKTSGSGNAMAVVGGRTALVDLSLSSVSNATGNFLTISGGVVHQRTASETRSDVGAQAQLNGTGFVKASGTTITYDNSTYQVTSDKAQPNGYASLDSNGKVPLTQINDALIGNVNYQGLWNASTNTPTLANPPSSGTKGYYYIVSTAGTFAGISFEVGDWIISNGSAWQKVDNTDAVSSVFGRTGNVVAANGDYTTAQVTESGNLYYTDGRARGALSFAAGSGAYNSSTGVITIPTNNNQIANGAGYITAETDTLQSVILRNGTTNTGFTISNSNNTYTSPGSTNVPFIYLYNTGTTSTSNSVLALRTNSATGGDPILSFDIGEVTGWSMGIDNSDSDKFKIANNWADLDSNTRFSMSLDGTAVFVGNLSAANLSGTNTGNVTIGTANGLSLSGQTLSLGLASSSANGALSSTDWTTFNSKQNALTNPVTGTGNNNYIAKFTSTGSTIGNSNIFDNGSNVGIGTASNTTAIVEIFGSAFQNGTNPGFRLSSSNTSQTVLAIVNTTSKGYELSVAGSGTGSFSGSFYIYDITTQNNRFVVSSAGNVLVNTVTDSGFKLDVNGTGRFSGLLTIKSANGDQLLLNNSGERFTQINFSNNNVSKANIWWDNTNTELVLLANSTGTGHLKIASTGAATFSNLSGSGNRIVVANSGGTLISAVIGSGLAFDGTTLTATGGSSGSISGSGNSGTIPVFTGTSSIGNSVITQSGGNIGINQNSPASRLSVTGDATQNVALVNINNTRSGGIMYSALQVINDRGNHSYGTVAEFRIASTGDSDRPSILFSKGGTGNNWSLGMGVYGGGHDNFAIGYRPSYYQDAWAISYLSITTGGNVLIGITTDNGNKLRVNGTIFSDSSVTATSFFESSDATLKTLVEDDYQAKGIDSVVAKLYIKNGKQELGYFAQDLQGILPSAVNKGTDGLLNLSYREVHTAKIAYLEEEIRQIKKRYEIN
jgi:hypothetical protein